MRKLFFVLFALSALPLAAQEFDLFDLNDFVDPRLHGALYDPHGNLTNKGDIFRLVRVASGGISDYAWRSTPTHDNVAFVQVVGSEYAGNLQANLKATFLDGQHDNALPRYRVMTQLARYTLHEASPETKKGGVSRIAARALVSLAIEENRLGDVTGAPTRRFNTELAAEVDMAFSLPGGRNATGSLIWTEREAATPGKDSSASDCHYDDASKTLICSAGSGFEPGQTHRTQRASYYYRLEEHTIANRYRFGLNIGVGGEKTDRWRWGATRVGFRGAMEIGQAGTLNVTWTPTYVPRDTGRHTTQEVAIFVDRTLFASLAH